MTHDYRPGRSAVGYVPPTAEEVREMSAALKAAGMSVNAQARALGVGIRRMRYWLSGDLHHIQPMPWAVAKAMDDMTRQARARLSYSIKSA